MATKSEYGMIVTGLTRSATLVFGATLCLGSALGQTPPAQPKKASPPSRVTSSAPNEPRPAAPQVVTIIHRLNGLKLFRLLIRSEEVQAISSLDEAFNLMDDVHANVIAGLTMDDGQTIAAWLPEAEVEFGPTTIPVPAPRPPLGASSPALPGLLNPKAATPIASRSRSGLFGEPELTVIGPDGKHLAAQFIGLDGITGLSILKLAGPSLDSVRVIKDETVGVGEDVRLFGPEPVARTGPAVSGEFYVRMGATPATILTVTRSSSGSLARLKVRSNRLSLANIGGVALNDAGQTLGIVDGIKGSEASILPTALIRRATRRVLAQQSSVPKPWLGVEGEPIATLNVEQIQNHGWQFDRASILADEHRGILLTSIMPGSPAALASFRAGDVILKVNGDAIQNADDFSSLLEQAGPSNSVRLTLARPDRLAEEAVSVKLSGILDPGFAFGLPGRTPNAKGFSLIDQGIETIALKPAVAARLGATAGLLVVYVQPATAAFDSGLLPGDVIQAIDGKPVQLPGNPVSLPSAPGPYTLEIVRKKQKLNVTLRNSEKKN